MPSGFLNTIAALTALQAKLAAVQWNGGPAFKKVAIFDMTNLAVALQELVTYDSAICLIVHDVETFENQKVGQELHCRQRREITLLIADRHFADRQKAMMGDPVSAPPVAGILALKDAVLNGLLVPTAVLEPGIYIEPVHGEQMVLEQKLRDQLQGRVAFTLGLRLVGGNIIVSLGRQPIP